MIRKTGIKIRIESLPYGAYIAMPISRRWRVRFGSHMRQFYPQEYLSIDDLSQAFFQGDYDLPECVRDHRYYGELQSGWDMVLLVDPWEFGHWLGYNAHIIAERGNHGKQ